MKDIFGKALLDYYHQTYSPPLLLHNEYGSPEVIPIESYFFDEDMYSDIETYAFQQFYGKVLDIGAATGRHALQLQHIGFDVTAMDISPSCGELMRERGVKKTIIDSIFNHAGEHYDTIFMLMNGIGVAGTIDGLKKLLVHLKKVLAPEGQLIVDSTDISYLYNEGDFPVNKYFGELTFQYEYKNVRGNVFHWLYIDQEKLMEIAESSGWMCQIIFTDESDAFLARLKME